MKNSRQTKLLVIMALVLAITGMTLGFAAFSSTLSISSSASVTPNSNDFKIKIYGYPETTTDNIFNINAYTSETTGYGFDDNTLNLLDAVASINNTTLSITGIDTKMTQPTDDHLFFFKIANEGQYDAYFDLSQLKINSPTSCIAEPGTSESLVEAVCNDITNAVALITEDGLEAQLKYNKGEITEEEFSTIQNEHFYGSEKTGSFKLEKNKSAIIVVDIFYGSSGNRADGPFSVTFEDIKLEFTTTPPNQE